MGEREGGGLGEDIEVPVVDAQWEILLNCECPGCKEQVDLMEFNLFEGDIDNLALGERANNVEVFCPICHFFFRVNIGC